jgi:DNA/RNA endonuclease G (NUC1)
LLWCFLVVVRWLPWTCAQRSAPHGPHPNQEGIKNADWTQYQTTVDQIEQATGYDLLSEEPVNVQKVIEAKR